MKRSSRITATLTAATLVFGASVPVAIAASPSTAEASLEAVAAVNDQSLSSPLSIDADTPLALEATALASGGTLTVTVDESVVAVAQASSATSEFLSSSSDDDVSYVAETGGSTGGSVYSVINSAQAQTSFAYNFSTDGAAISLSLDEATGVVTVLNADGGVENVVLPAWARDAAGNDVETSYRVDGSVLTQEVRLTGTESFPVVADPELACDALFCTVEFNKAETDDAVRYTASDALLPGGVCAVLIAVPPIAVPAAACAAIIAASAANITSVATDARDQGQCLGLRAPIAVLVAITPVIHNTGNCY